MSNVQAAGRASLTVLAQGLSSVTNFAAGAFALDAADGDIGAFGRFAIAFQLCQVVIAIGHASSGTTVLIHGAKNDADGSVDQLRAGAATAAIVIGGGLAAVITVGGLVAGSDLGTTLLLAAGAPALTSQYTLRASYFAQNNAAGVVRADAIWLAVLLAAAAGDAMGGWHPSPDDYLAVWLIGAAVSALPSLLVGLGRGRRHLGLFWATTGPQAIRTGADSLLARSVFVFTLFAAERIVGVEASGVIAAAVLVFSPLTVVHTSSAAVVIPANIRRRGIHIPSPRLPLQAAAAIAAITLGWAAFLLVFNETRYAFGPFDLDSAGVTGALFAATLVRFLAMAFWRGPELALRIADAATASLQARMVGTCVQWIVPVIGFAVADVNGGAFGLGIATWVGALVAWERYRQLGPPSPA
ncbi:MAG: hypothetical protein R8F63_14550 [Acidimicrobiales bacterium]|nr:hypothetical protein [Acidimicrobiales bacterium]